MITQFPVSRTFFIILLITYILNGTNFCSKTLVERFDDDYKGTLLYY